MSSCSSDDQQQFPVMLVGLGLYSVSAVSLVQSKCTSYHLDHSQEQLSQQIANTYLPFTCTVSLQRKKFFIKSLGVLCIKWRVTPVYGCWQKASTDALVVMLWVKMLPLRDSQGNLIFSALNEFHEHNCPIPPTQGYTRQVQATQYKPCIQGFMLSFHWVRSWTHGLHFGRNLFSLLQLAFFG